MHVLWIFVITRATDVRWQSIKLHWHVSVLGYNMMWRHEHSHTCWRRHTSMVLSLCRGEVLKKQIFPHTATTFQSSRSLYTPEQHLPTADEPTSHHNHFLNTHPTHSNGHVTCFLLHREISTRKNKTLPKHPFLIYNYTTTCSMQSHHAWTT